MGEVEPSHPTCFGHVHLEPRVVTGGGADVAHPGDNSGGTGEIHGIVEQVSELKSQAVVVPETPGGREDRRCISSHVETVGGAVEVQPAVPGFTITGELGSSVTGSTWAADRSVDDRGLALQILPVADASEARAQAAHLMVVLERIGNEHLVHQHGAIALADGTLALVLDQVTGGTLAHVVETRGQLSVGETVTTVAPLFGALADLHHAGIVHGELAASNILFAADGRPVISDLGVARLLGRPACRVDADSGFVAPELVAGAEPSPAADVYAMAALGWFCLTGVPPAPATRRPSLTTLRPDTPPRLVEVLTSCLSTDPWARPSAGAAAVEAFDAAPAESVRLAPVFDPAAEMTRRIRAAAVPAPHLAAPSKSTRHRDLLAISVVALLVALALGGGAAWVWRRPPVPVQPVVVRTVTPVAPKSPPTTTSRGVTDVVGAPDSPRIAAAQLLQALADARALAYATRNTALLDLVYAPGAAGAVVDQSNIAAARKNGGTYVGLAFHVKDVAFLKGMSDTARIRATVVTPAYQTGQPDGRTLPHAQDVAGPSVFTLRLTPDGWRILSLTAP